MFGFGLRKKRPEPRSSGRSYKVGAGRALRRNPLTKLPSRALRSSSPYRPSRLPRPSRDRSLRRFLGAVFLLVLLFSMGHIWKAQQVAQLCSRLDDLRRRQQELREKLKTLRLQYQEASTYSNIESLAREKLGMYPSQKPPVVIAALDEHFAAFKTDSKSKSTRQGESR
jgi:cell division protein FtsL